LKPKESYAFDQLEALSYLPFDSHIFGFPFFRLTEMGNSLACDLEALGKFNLPSFACDAKVSSTDDSSVIRLQKEGFVHVCDQVTYDISPTSSKFLPEVDAIELRTINRARISLHADNFRNDRLSRDSRIPNATVKRFYSEWISNSFGLINKAVYSLESGLCITQLKQDVLKIDLVSVLEKSKGVGTRLIRHILAQASEAKVSRVEVTTESDNTGAIKAYTRNGFQEKKRSSCLHLFHHEKQNSE
jgi:hypothetical protein